MTATCPHCGESTSEDAAIWRGKWWLHPGGTFFDSEDMKLTRTQSRVLYAIARANGAAVTHEEVPAVSTAASLATHLRDIRKRLGDLFPVRLNGRSVSWSDAA